MHNICGLTLIFIISNLLLLIHGNAVGESPRKSMYDLLLEHSSSKCPYLKTKKLLEPKPSFLNRCSDYATLRSITKLTRETQYDFLCLLYYNNLISLCESPLLKSIVINDTNIDAITKSYDLERTCRDLSESKLLPEFKQAEGLLSNFKQEDVCTFLCKELLDSGVIPICSLSAATSNLTSSLRKINAKTLELVQNPPQPDPVKEEKKTDGVVHQQVDVPIKPKLVSDSAPQDTNQSPVKIETGNVPNVEQKTLVIEDKLITQAKTASEPVSKTDESKPDSTQGGTNSVDNKSVSQPGFGENPLIKDDMEKPPVKSEEVAVVKTGDTLKVQTNEAKQETKDESTGGDKKSVEDTGSKVGDPPVNDKAGSDQQPPPVKTEEQAPPIVQGNKGEGEDILIDEKDDDETQDSMGNDDDMAEPEKEPQKADEIVKSNPKPQETDEDVMIPSYSNSNSDEEDSFFFIYFMMVCAVFILGYIGYHNKQKVLALVIEGRRGRRGSRRGRPNSANYHKLDSNLEEAVTSACNKNATNIIY